MKIRKRLYTETIPVNKNLFARTVLIKKNLFAGTLLANKDLFAGTPQIGSINIFDSGNGFFGKKMHTILVFQFWVSNTLFLIWTPELWDRWDHHY